MLVSSIDSEESAFKIAFEMSLKSFSFDLGISDSSSLTLFCPYVKIVSYNSESSLFFRLIKIL